MAYWVTLRMVTQSCCVLMMGAVLRSNLVSNFVSILLDAKVILRGLIGRFVEAFHFLNYFVEFPFFIDCSFRVP